VIDAGLLARRGWNVELILNDFAAATWGLMALDKSGQKIFKAGKTNNEFPRALVGPGTGLGLGFLVPVKNGFHVQGTHGGHMLAAALTAEHHSMIEAVQKVKNDNTIPVFENFVSGIGLMNIYKALCVISGEKPQAERTEDLLQSVQNPRVKDTLRLFHEFFGLFAQTITVTGHAYGGLYMMGGVLERLEERNLFDFKSFENFFVLKGVASVQQALNDTPVIRVTDPALTFKGLINVHA
jgi:glucokinase